MDSTFVDRALGSNIPYITFAAPVFFLLIGVELVVALWEHKPFYRLHDSVSNLSCGMIEQVISMFLKGLLFAGYEGTYSYATRTGMNPVDVPSYSAGGKWLAAILLFLGVDCAYYWFHRVAHEYNAPWAGHVVHHSSEDFNLAVALRQGSFKGAFSWVFYLPLAVIAFPPLWFAAMLSFVVLYQFGIHTRTVGKLGPLEWVFNTPSHHRVHHARNPKYLDRNYGGTLIIWDRIFGTFQAEEEEPVYGLTKPLNSWNPLWANLHLWRDLCRDAWLAPHWIDKLRIWFMRQGWRPEGLPTNPIAPAAPHQTAVRYDSQLPRGLNAYALAHFAGALPMTGVLMAAGTSHARGGLFVLAVLVFWALLNIGGIFDHHRWALPSEILRLPVTAAALAARLPDGSWLAPAQGGLALAVVASWLCLLAYRRQFDGVRQPPSRVIGSSALRADAAESAPPKPKARFPRSVYAGEQQELHEGVALADGIAAPDLLDTRTERAAHSRALPTPPRLVPLLHQRREVRHRSRLHRAVRVRAPSILPNASPTSTINRDLAAGPARDKLESDGDTLHEHPFARRPRTVRAGQGPERPVHVP
jgi:sterol desaturase/sphingolipid hydroxylase (fatty acid hydroxylase superfamily)